MSNTVEAAGYGQGAAVIEDGSSAGAVIDVGFSSGKADELAERTMHDNFVYDMAEEEPSAELLPDPEVYEAARRIDKERWFYRFAKRTFDIVFSGVVLVLFCWLYAIIAVVIKIDSPAGPVIFSQERVGKNGKTFRMYKFRTMVPDAEKQLDNLLDRNEKTGPVFKISADPRILSSGVWLRKLSLDELPQFRNVLKGDIPSRILKTGQEELVNSARLFALPAKEMRTKKALFPQFKMTSGTYLRTVRNLLKNLSALSSKTQRVFAKRDFSPFCDFELGGAAA